MKVALISTFLNEEKTIGSFVLSIARQSKKPDEIVLNDGGSTDTSVQVLQMAFDEAKLEKVTIIRKKGNRSVGRNAAIARATSSIIASSDVGCILDQDWLKNITAPFVDSSVDVVAGYYKAKAETLFQKCLIPYVFVMPDKLTDSFLPSTRSMAFRKAAWEKIGKFPEVYSHNEDYVFANRLKKHKMKIVVRNDAIVTWIPRDNFPDAFVMFFRFALGDAEAQIIRPKVLLLFLRFIIFLTLLWISVHSFTIGIITFFLFSFYMFFAIIKNYKYVNAWQAVYLLPLLQLTADIAIISGSTIGALKRYGIYRTSN